MCYVIRDGERTHRMRLEPVRHSRLWLTLWVSTVVLCVGLFGAERFLRTSDTFGLWLFLIWGIGVPLSLGGWWAASVWRRSFDRAKRIERGHCAYCDYDLTGNTSGRCPECGTDSVPQQ